MRKHRNILIFGAFLLLGLLVYGHSLWNEFVRWDDGMLIYENGAIREISPRTLQWIFTHFDPELYIPLTFLTYQIDYLIGGTNPFGYHLTSLLLHVINAFLVFLIARRIMSYELGIRNNEGNSSKIILHNSIFIIPSLFVGLLFLLHPLHTEAVAWASGRKDVLSGMFFLGSIILYLQTPGVRAEKGTGTICAEHPTGRSGKLYLSPFLYYLSLALFLLGLLSKVMVATLPAILILIDLLIGRKLTRETVLEKIPFFLLALLFVAVGFLGKHNLVEAAPLSIKVFMAFISAAFYLWKIIWPVGFSVLYTYSDPIAWSSPRFLVSAGVVMAIVAIAGSDAFFRKQRGLTPLLAFGFLWYFITLAPTFVNLGVKGEMDMYFASDRYAYLPSVGIFLVIGFCVCWFAGLLEPTSQRANMQRFLGGIIASVCIVLAILSYKQSLVWADTTALFTNVIERYPASSHVAYNNLGNMERLRGNFDRSIEYYKQALALRQHAKTWSNLGAAYRRKRMFTEALDAYAKALAIDVQSPYAHFGRGIVQAELGQLTDAKTSYEEAITLLPTYEEVYVNLGSILEKEGRLSEALGRFDQAIAINEFLPEAHYNRAIVLTKFGRIADAIAAYKRVVRMAPGVVAARINLGILLANTGKREEAIVQFREVLRLDPQNASAKQALSQLRSPLPL